VTGRDGLFGRSRLSREDGLVTLEATHLQEPHVGGHDVAETKTHDIAGDEPDDIDLLQVPITLNEGRTPDLRMERFDCLLGAVLVDEAEHHADAHDENDDACLGGVPNDGGDDRSPDKEHQQETAKLPSKDAPEADAVAAKGVWTHCCQSPVGLCAA
jgi:hypothetical protein